MQYALKSGTLEKQRTDCLIVGIYDRRQLTPAAQALDTAAQGRIAQVLRDGDMDGKPGQTLLLHALPGVAAARVLLVGLGPEKSFDVAAYRKALGASVRALRATGASEAISTLTQLDVAGHDAGWKLQQAVLAAEAELYRFDQCRGEQARAELPAVHLRTLHFALDPQADKAAAERGLALGRAIATGQNFARDLGNLPGNICTPAYLASAAKKLGAGERAAVKVKVLEEADMKKLGMGSLLSVSRGSRQPAKLIVLEYLHGAKKDKPIALVGKGLTFDAGGISIKPAANMDEMKFDMCGGAAVLGVFKAVAELRLPINLVGVVAASENLPDGDANKPGDVVTSMAGITIEVLNTDAEGRLILADALTYTERTYDPAVCIDMATLTGACVVALGAYPSGLFSNHAPLARALSEAGEQIGDRVWELPMWAEYDEHIKSECADIANIATKGAGQAGATIGAVFLQRFARKMKWAHLDIAGTAWVGKKATGRPVPLLVQYLLNQAPQAEVARRRAKVS